jgi:hypothetical protein
MNLVRFWWRFDRPVDARLYAANGLALTAIKHTGDVLLVWLGTGRFWTPLDYLASVRTLFATSFHDVPPWLLPLLVLWALPLISIGVTLTMRRAIDAGLNARRGESPLVALPGGRTRLEGSTWYQIEMAPEGYWPLYSDYLIHGSINACSITSRQRPNRSGVRVRL